MEKTKYYYDTRFGAEVLRESHDLFLSKIAGDKDIEGPSMLHVRKGHEAWDFDSRAEFLAEYDDAEFSYFMHRSRGFGLSVEQETSKCRVAVKLSSRADIEDVFHVFERNVEANRIVAVAAPIRIFIGHGQSPQWRDLKDHLHDMHGLDVVAYEIGPRAGLTVKEVLEEMLVESSFAILVLTGEDQHTDGELHARQNVVHELGLFQGRLGFTRAIVALEGGVQEFSNILGINQIRFSKGNIRETFGEVVATVRREFRDNDSSK